MKKVYLLFFTFLIGMSVNAQMMQGSFSIDPYVGVPNWANSLLYNQYNGDEVNIQEYGQLEVCFHMAAGLNTC